jgi:hypothetical protein
MNTVAKSAILIASFATCVMAYIMDDKTYFDLMKFIWQASLIGLIFAEYGLSRVIPLFIMFTVCLGIYLLPYKYYTDLPSLVIENGLIIALFNKYKHDDRLKIITSLILLSGLYGLVKEVLGYGCDNMLYDIVIGSFTVMTMIIFYIILLFEPHKEPHG